MSDTVTPAGARPRPPGPPAGPPRGPQVRTGDGGARWRVLRVVAVLVVIGVAGRLLFSVEAPTDVLQLPDQGEVRAARLANGTPVFLVHTDEGAAVVVEALPPDMPGPVGSMVGWCSVAEQFIDPHEGRLFDGRGQRSTISMPGRVADAVLVDPEPPMAEDLVRRHFDRLEGRDGAEDPVMVGAPLTAEEVAVDPLDRPADARTASPPPSCRLSDNPVVADEVPVATANRNRLLDHGFLTRLLRLPRQGWQITDGFLLVGPDGGATWCRVDPAGIPPSCPDPGPVPLALGITADQAGGAWTVVGGPLAARVDEGVVVEVAALPRSTWRGGSLQGTQSYVGMFAGLDLERGELRLEPFPVVGDVDCLGEATRSPGLNGTPAGIQAVDGDTVFAVDGAEDPEVIAQAPLPDQEVEVLVDAATCRALRVTST